ncbi:carbamoyltransferase family protein [Gordonia sp. DT30]|uniref:carbamoyltransferase family protein n=1 Tax=unclassified Gordonia (in: high G+C Gram-positive bacteria) TaxID=2657482 RepID=UPI003CEB8F07
MRVLGINAVFHDSAAALVVDGQVVAAAEEERFSRRKHGKRPVPFSAWELPENAIRWVLSRAGLTGADLDAVAYSYDPDLAADHGPGLDPGSEPIRTDFARRAPLFLRTLLPRVDLGGFVFVRHHVAHAASAGLLHPRGDCAVLTCDGRGENTSMLAGHYLDGQLKILAEQQLPHSLGLFYEDLTEHLGFARSSDEYKVMALASYGQPRFAADLRERVHATSGGHFVTEPIDWDGFVPRREPTGPFDPQHADLACSVQMVTEEVLLELTTWLHRATGAAHLAMAGGTALNCVANTRIHHEGPFESVWVQPAAGDSGTALGAALAVSADAGDTIAPFPGADLGREFDDRDIAAQLTAARVPFERPDDIGAACAQILADDGILAWFQGRSEFGPRALGHRSLLANPSNERNLERINDVKGREQFRPIAPMVLADRAAEIFSRGPIPSPYMLFVHDVHPDWRVRLPAVTHVDGTARIQTVDRESDPQTAHLLECVAEKTGVPVIVNTSLNTAGRPMVDSVLDALELFGSAPVDAMALGPFLVRRHD